MSHPLLQFLRIPTEMHAFEQITENAGGEQETPEASKDYAGLVAEAEQDIDFEDEFRPLVIDTADNHLSSESAPSSSLPSTNISPVPPQPEYISLPLVGTTPPDSLANSDDLSGKDTDPFPPETYLGSERSLGSWSDSELVLQPPATNSMTLLANKNRQSAPSKTRRKSDKILPVASESGENYICPICKEVLPNNHDLTKHIRSHNTNTASNPNSCTICGKVLSSQSSLDRHMLVHSGERPFRCKICKMSFTTNGNMHRHSRIHDKEVGASGHGLLTEVMQPPPRRGRRKNSEDSDSAASSARKTSTNGDEGHAVTGVKRKAEEMEGLTAPPAKRYLVGGLQRNYTPTPQNSPYKKMLDSSAKKELEMGEEDSDKPFSCPACTKTFLCRYGLETHLDVHANFSTFTRCVPCEQTFRSPKSFQMHALVVHLRQRALRPVADGAEAKGDAGARANVPAGFHDLEFVDFSSANFPLVAKAWCEKNQRRASSVFHDFTCKRCQHAFPCPSALTMHMETHAPEFLATCVRCDVTFSSRDEFENHVITHNTDKVVNTYSRKPGTDDNLIQDAICKEEFLLVLDLQVKKEGGGSRKQTLSPYNHAAKRDDMKPNNDYYKRLNRLKPVNAVIPYSGEEEGDNDFADVQQIVENTASSMSMEGLAKHMAAGDAGVLMPRLHRMPAEGHRPAEPRRILHVPPPLKPLGVNKGHVMKPEPMTGDEEDGSPVKQEMKAKDSKDKDEGKEGPFQCKYCDEIFNNYRAYKGHVRAHLGLSPYKCNLCSYSSADKSTLIRHLRTHNGERPFQCLICEFAFTTKANCERHVRKKHACDNKEDIESAIGYNQYLNDSSIDNDAFASPDTVCKYCGEDFKFFRALKHHLRSHSSCRYKPFMCKICNNGFSTKANCVRHIQKQHTEIEQNQLEKNISVSEFFQGEAGEALLNGIDSLSPEMKPKSESPYPGPGGKMAGPLPVAHNPATPGMGMGAPQIHPAFPKPSLGTYITTPPIAPIKREAPDTSSEQPLDFSMKSGPRGPLHTPPQYLDSRPSSAASSVGSQDEPMDLSKKSSSCLPSRALAHSSGLPGSKAPSSAGHPAMSPSVSSAEGFTPMKLPVVVQPPSALLSPDYGMLRYKKEYQKFYNPMVGRLQCPYCKMLFKHGLKLLVHIRSHTNERPFRCDFCTAGFTIKTNLDRHLKTRHPQMAEAIERAERAVAMGEQLSDSDDSFMFETNNNVSKMRDNTATKLFSSKSPVPSYSSDSELAPLNQILDAADTAQFQGFFHTSSPPDDATAMLKAAADMCARSDGKKEASTASATAVAMEMDQMSTISERSGDSHGGPDGVGSARNEDGSPKKKRNSYADSPHKLQCPYCPRAFPWISSLKRHILTHTGQKPFKCPQCPVTFSTKSNRERHMIRKHGLNVHDPATRQMMDRPYKCHLCVFSSFAAASNLMRHYREKHPEKDIPESLMQNVTQSMTAEEALMSVEKLTDVKMENGGSISEHSEELNSMADFDGEDEEDEDELLAEMMDCSKFEDGLGRKLFEHSTPASERSSRTTTPDPAPIASGGDKAAAAAAAGHVNPERDNYNVDKITECWKCQLTFETRKALLRHLKEHNVDLPYKCYLCDASYEHRRECLVHKMTRHGADWDTMKDKNKVANLDDFVGTMDKIVEETLSGNLSAKVVDHLDDLKPESDYAQRKVYCSLCPKRFWSLQDLRRHMRSHTGERPFECDICQARFTLKHSMMRHRRKHSDPGANLSSSDDEGANGPEENVTAAATPSTTPSAGSKKPSASPRSAYSLRSHPHPATGGGSDLLDNSDMLKNLLGVGDDDLNMMLNSADDAAKLLGVK